MGLMDDDIIIPDFPDDDDPDLDVAAEESQNRTFLIVSAVLAGIFVLGLCAALALIFLRPQEQDQEAAAIEQTNEALFAAATQTALAAQVTNTPVASATGAATATSTSPPSATPTPLLPATQTDVAEFATLSETQIAEGTTTPFETVEVPTGQATLAVTQIGGGTTTPGVPTPTRIVSGVGVTITATALPDTGVGIAGGAAGLVLAAVVLVAVVVVARRLRLS